MTTVLVHGIPETAALWRPLTAALSAAGVHDEVVSLSPPGFGAPAPAGFGATIEEYRRWLVGKLEVLDTPEGNKFDYAPFRR